ncbi:ABC transporter substrate-binding protein [Aerosakkonemataceae cyanobacterium BLCC-F50]|uniref:ABC transporter substrate-binding protein n=1 Tax=Floridaenema flaviceps BLCC-F50 TaxID=3153642 RepID=A0ABV4XL91_9CYAN
MTKVVVFRIATGDFEQGFPLNLEIRENGRLCAPEVSGFLAPAPDLLQYYEEWQQAYYDWLEDPNSRSWGRQFNVPPQSNTNFSSEDSRERVRNAADNLEQEFNNWLNNSPLASIREELLQTVRRDESVKFFIHTNNPELQKLPWELWSFLRERYGHPEVALCSIRTPGRGALSIPVRILVILGSDDNIDIETDWNVLQENLGTAQLTLLMQPESEIFRQALIHQSWNIIFFAGHSYTEPGGNDGRIWINNQDNLSPQQLGIALERAARNGLKLAIFNSCDGLGLARQLERLRIPNIIVMRQPIHDEVAQKFLNDFLISFANGASLERAVHEARDQLRLIEHRSPNASWLPVIFQNPEEPPLFYPQETLRQEGRNKKFKFWQLSAIAFVLSLLVFGISHHLLPKFYPQPTACEIQLNKDLRMMSCGEKALMNPKESQPQLEKQKGIDAIANRDYSQAVNLLTKAWNEKKDPETLIYLNNAKIMAGSINPANIYTIPLIVPFSNSPTFVSEDIVKGVAWLQERFNNDPQNKLKIKVLLADDSNNKEQARKIAQELVKRQDVLAVIGHYSSHLSINVKPIYESNKLVLLSPTSTANDGLSSTHPNNIFFRPVSTTQLASYSLVDYLLAKGYQKVAIFYTTGKAFSEASKKDFKTALNDRIQIVADFDLREDTSKIKSKVAWVKQKFKDTAIALFPDAYTISNDSNKLEVIKENNGELLIVGGDTVPEDKVLALGKTALQKMVITVPFYASDNTTKEFQEFWGKTELNWPVIMSYDALQMVIDAIQIQLFKPSREGIQKALANPKFSSQGLSGKITLKGSDRQENTNTLIAPDCSSEPCTWREIKN